MKWIGIFAASFALWWCFIADHQLQDVLLGVACAVLVTLLCGPVLRRNAPRVRFRAKDLLQCRYIPGYVVIRCIEIVKVLIFDLLRIRPAHSLMRTAPFDEVSVHSPLQRARRALATLYTTAAPNFIIIGIDREHGTMLFHQIERTSVSQMTQNLGAKQ